FPASHHPDNPRRRSHRGRRSRPASLRDQVHTQGQAAGQARVSGGGYGCCLPWLERNILRRRFVPGRLTRTHSLPSAKRASIEATPSLLSDSFFWRRAADDSWAQSETMFGLCSLKLLVDPLLDQLCVINADPVCNAP